MQDAQKNLVQFSSCVAASMAAAIVGYLHPCAILPVTDTTITALSVMFGLSMAVYSLASREVIALNKNRPNDPMVARQISQKITRDNNLTTQRQKLLISIFLLAIILGILLKVADNIPHAAPIVPWLSAFFSFFGALSLLGAFYLPGLLSKLHKRNQHFGLDS